MLGGAAGEVEQQPLALHRGAQAQHEVALDRLQHVLRHMHPVGERRQAGAGAPLGVVEHGVEPLAQPRDPDALRELAQALRADPVGGELGAQVGAALLRLAHARDEPLDLLRRGRAGGDHDALLRERAGIGGHRPGHAPAHVGVVGARDGEPDQRRRRRVDKHGGDERDVRQVGAPGEGVVEHPRAALRVILAEHGGDGGGHRAEVHGDVLGLHHHLPARVEQRGGAVAALLDVGRVRGADQRGAHLLAGGAQRAGEHLQLDRVEAHAPAPSSCRCTVP